MSGGTIRTAAVLSILWLTAVPALGAQVVSSADARRAVTNPAVAATDTALNALAQAGKTSNLAVRLELIADDNAIEMVAREWLVDRGLHELALLPPTPQARGVVQRLSRRGPVTFTRADPDHADRATPLYDTGATARFVLNVWQRSAARDQAQTELLAGRTDIVDRFAQGNGLAELDPTRAGIADAFAAAPLSSLARQNGAIVAAIAAGRRVDELALILGERLADVEMLNLVIGNADAPVALAAIRAAPRQFDSVTALELLTTASRRADIASAAMLGIGNLARDSGSARDLLFDSLEDPALGPSAATALASLQDPTVASELGRRLRTSRSESLRRVLVLALKLDASPASRDELQRFADTRKGSAQLQKKLRQWLAP